MEELETPETIAKALLYSLGDNNSLNIDSSDLKPKVNEDGSATFIPLSQEYPVPLGRG